MQPSKPGPRKFRLRAGEASPGKPSKQRRDRRREHVPGALVIEVPALPIGNPVEIPPRLAR